MYFCMILLCLFGMAGPVFAEQIQIDIPVEWPANTPQVIRSHTPHAMLQDHATPNRNLHLVGVTVTTTGIQVKFTAERHEDIDGKLVVDYSRDSDFSYEGEWSAAITAKTISAVIEKPGTLKLHAVAQLDMKFQLIDQKGNPVSDQNITVMEQKGDDFRQREVVPADAQGNFHCLLWADKKYILEVERDALSPFTDVDSDHHLAKDVLATGQAFSPVANAEGTQKVACRKRLMQARLQLMVSGPDGEAKPFENSPLGLKVALLPKKSGGRPYLFRIIKGQAAVFDTPVGDYFIQLEGRSGVADALKVKPDSVLRITDPGVETPQSIVLIPRPKYKVSFQVVNTKSGLPLTQAKVTLTCDGGTPLETTTEQTGVVATQELFEGNYVVSVRGEDGQVQEGLVQIVRDGDYRVAVNLNP